MGKQILQWHPAFQAACRVELQEDEDFLQFLEEHTLTKKPLQMDILIIKVDPGHVVKKSIGKIFRRHNIVEYKSPDDYVCINDFYKVFGYACIYQSDTQKVMEIRPEDITVTLVCSGFPKKMMEHIIQRYGVAVKEEYCGIYHVEGLLFPLQLVITKKLPKEEYMWLSRLQRKLDVKSDIEPLVAVYRDKADDPKYQAVMDLIVRANREQDDEEEKEMLSETLREIFADELKEKEKKGLEKGLEKGTLLKLISLVRRKIQKGFAIEEIAEMLEEPVEAIYTIAQMLEAYPADSDEMICDRLYGEHNIA